MGRRGGLLGEKNGIEIPTPYLLLIPGVCPAGGPQQSRLLILECYALTKIGYGQKRIRDVLTQYDAISGLHTDGKSAYTKQQLEDWADKVGIAFR